MINVHSTAPKKVFVALIILFFATPGWAQNDPPSEAMRGHCTREHPCTAVYDPALAVIEACLKAGGTWEEISHDTQQMGCVLSTKDAGKICRDSSECQGGCMAILTDEQLKRVEAGETLIMDGQCSPITPMGMGCGPVVEGGKVSILCRD